MKKVFIDGKSGTTGLRIYERLAQRTDIELLILSDDERRNPEARKRMLNACDIAFLCLPDDAARESVSMIENENTVVLDTSTAHRTNPDWTYGFPELEGQREKIRVSRRIANPGCHASGFVALIAPLVSAGLIDPNEGLTCFSLTGYSGGGKKMIAEYEDEGRDSLLNAPRMYGLTQKHKHLPEMAAVCGLCKDPIFCPIVAPYYAGMEVTVPLFKEQIKGSLEDVKNAYRKLADSGLVRFVETADEAGLLSANALEGRDDMQLTVSGNEDRILLVARFDNLGKGASGAAIQNMNLVLGLPEDTGLNV